MGWDDLHTTAARELRDWTPPDAQQTRLRDEYLDHLAAHADGHRKAGPAHHLTASCLVLDPTGERVLLTHHRKARAWFQFGGHLEVGDAGLRDTALREAREESGVDELRLLGGILELDRHDLVGDFVHCRQHWDVRYVAVADPRAVPVTSAESLDVAWWPVDDLPNPELARLVERGRARLSTTTTRPPNLSAAVAVARAAAGCPTSSRPPAPRR